MFTLGLGKLFDKCPKIKALYFLRSKWCIR